MKEDIRKIIITLKNKNLVSKLPFLKEINKIAQLGSGTSNLNYLIITPSKKIVLRKNIVKTSKNKLKREFRSLKAIESLNIAPKILHFQKDSKIGSFIILNYLEGNTLDKTKYVLDLKFLKLLAKEVALLHSIPISSLKKKLSSQYKILDRYLYELKQYEKKFKPFLNSSEFFDFMKDMFVRFSKDFKNKKFSYKSSLIHTDIQEQNIILNYGRIKFIDWEFTMISDPATEVAYVVTQFGKPFSLKQKNIFINEYLKHRKDSSLKERVELYIPIRYYIDFLWSVLQTAKIKKGLIYYANKEKRFLQQKKYTFICIERLLDNNIIDRKTSVFLREVVRNI